MILQTHLITKNKFAIIDYLYHIIKSEDINLLAIILTHNFDFLRTQLRAEKFAKRTNVIWHLEIDRKITLTQFQIRSDIRNPLINWQTKLSNCRNYNCLHSVFKKYY